MKERLTGAIILVAALVLLVPELLTGPGRSAPAPPADSAGSSDLRSYVIDLAEDGAARTTPATAAITEPSVPVATPEGAASGGTEPDPEGLEHSSMPQADAAGDGAGASGAETRVAEAENASQGRGDTVSASAGTTVANVTRDARGAGDAAPATSGGSRADANATRAQESGTARAAVQKDAAPAARPEPRTASASAEPRSGWVVQVGSFASRDNAERLARELRGKGFATFVNESSGKGKRYWRVRVGPERSREAANALRTKLRAAGHSGGAVMSYP